MGPHQSQHRDIDTVHFFFFLENPQQRVRGSFLRSNGSCVTQAQLILCYLLGLMMKAVCVFESLQETYSR